MQSLSLDVPDEGLLQFREILAARGIPVRAIIGSGDVERQPPLAIAGEEELPLGIGRLADARRQQLRKRRRRGRRWASAAARADHAYDRIAFADIGHAAAAARCRTPAPSGSCAAPAIAGRAPAGRSPPRRAPARTRSSPPRERRATPRPSAPCLSRTGDSTANPRARQRLTRRRGHPGATIEAYGNAWMAGIRVPSWRLRSAMHRRLAAADLAIARCLGDGAPAIANPRGTEAKRRSDGFRVSLPVPCRAIDSAGDLRARYWSERTFRCGSRLEKFFTLSFPERQGKGMAALPCRLSPRQRRCRRGLGDRGLFLRGSPATGKSSATWRRVSTPTKFSGSGSIRGMHSRGRPTGVSVGRRRLV